MRLPLLLLALVLAACSSSGEKDGTKPPIGLGPTVLLKDRPYVAHWDALERDYLPRGEFIFGRDYVWAPIHSSTNATIYFVAFKGAFPRYVNPEHEETFFIVSGAGTLDLAGGKKKPIEGGFVVRIPPGFAHGFTAAKDEPLEAILVAAPTITNPDARVQDTDVPDATGWIYCEDVTSEGLLDLEKKPLPKLPPSPLPGAFRAPLDRSRFSTLQLAAIGRTRLRDHKHVQHDETVILFAQEGLGFMRINEVVDPVQPIQIIHIPAGAVHSYEHKANGHGRAISIFTPAYDDTDFVLVKQTEELKAPKDYKLTPEDGGWVEPGNHAVKGDTVAPRASVPVEIKGDGSDH